MSVVLGLMRKLAGWSNPLASDFLLLASVARPDRRIGANNESRLHFGPLALFFSVTRFGLPLLLVVLIAIPAFGYIEALTAMSGVVKESDVILKGTVDAVSLEKKVLILKVGKTIKGTTSYARIRIDMSAGPAWHPDVALKHAVVGTPVSIFYKKADNSEKAQISLIYLNRFFMTAQGGDEAWRFSQIELGMNRVFHGTPEELGTLMEKVVPGRVKAPAPNAQLKPWTRESLDALPPPPKEGEKWPDFDPAAAFKP